MNDFDGKTVAMAVSGGVDSLYCLLSLKERHPGARVFALHALFLPVELRGPEYGRMLDVLRTGCEQLGVELQVADCSGEFARLVMNPFAEAYFAGSTPNPCAGCNRDIKFGLLWEKAAGLGAELLVTGHYARLEFDGRGRPMLLNGLDAAKDQSYFLALTPLERLARARFPLGAMRKSEVVAKLEERNSSSEAGGPETEGGTGETMEWCGPIEQPGSGPAAQPAPCERPGSGPRTAADRFAAAGKPVGGRIEVPAKGESQEICFIPGNDYRAFLADWAAGRPPAAVNGLPGAGGAEGTGGSGDMLLPDGRSVGRHKGLWAYTEGQRKGLGVAWSEPLYVIGKDLARNALLLGTAADLNSRSCICENLNFLLPSKEWPEVVYAKTRYRQALQPARVEFLDDGRLRIEFIETLPSAPAAPGQVAAIYAPLGAGPDVSVQNGSVQCFRLLAGGEIVRGEARF